MGDLISRQAAIDELNKMKIYRPLDSDRYVISDCLNKIVNLPSVQPKQKHGRWVKYKNWYACSECGKEMFFAGTYDESQHYCYNCGARMEGEVIK